MSEDKKPKKERKTFRDRFNQGLERQKKSIEKSFNNRVNITKANFNRSKVGKAYNFMRSGNKREQLKNALKDFGKKHNPIEKAKNLLKNFQKFIKANKVIIRTWSIVGGLFMLISNTIVFAVSLAQGVGPSIHYYCNPNAPEWEKSSSGFIQYCKAGANTYTGDTFMFPTQDKNRTVTSPFGAKRDMILQDGRRWVDVHTGIDLIGGGDVVAALPGVVSYVSNNLAVGYGVIVDHEDRDGKTFQTVYWHQESIPVKVGDKVERGQSLGPMGTTGFSTGIHLHFEVRIGGEVVDPAPYLDGADDYELLD